jgi:uncharacterized membrane protein (UPF0127 family)
MKDTAFPLDWLFIKQDGTVANVVDNAEPYSIDSFNSQGPVIAALGLSSDEIERTGVSAGDRIMFPE